MAQQADNPAQALPQAGRSKKWIVIGVLALLLAVGAGGAAWFMLKSGGSGDVEGGAAGQGESPGGHGKSTAATALFFTLGSSLRGQFRAALTGAVPAGDRRTGTAAAS